MARVDWRRRSSWTSAELAARLEHARRLGPNFETSRPLDPPHGWNRVCSKAVIGREEPGAQIRGGVFERAQALVRGLRFSDPRIVQPHFDALDPLEGATVLLELKAPFALRYLCPVRVHDLQLHSDGLETRFRFRFVTLEGHIEQGAEWFTLAKDHASGEVRFKIDASWRAGTLPNWWSAAGFALLGRRYQRAWHHLAHLRLRALLTPDAGTRLSPRALPPIQFVATRAPGRRLARVEEEQETMRRGRVLTSFQLAGFAGALEAFRRKPRAR